jgi:hypothetical protein
MPWLPLAVLTTLTGLVGCGGGGSNNPPPPGPVASHSRLSGTVTDGNGAPIVGATVTLDNQTATTTQYGAYLIPDVVVAAGQTSRVATISATHTLSGRVWNGQNMVEVLTGEPVTSNVHIVLSDVATQGAISGTVRDEQNHPLAFARVFAADGPYTDPQGGSFFTVFSSYNVYTDLSGNFTLSHLKAFNNYTVMASQVGRINQTVSSIVVTPGNTTSVNFTLNPASANSTVPKVVNFSAMCITTPDTPTRAAGSVDRGRGYNALRHFLLEQHGWLRHRAADASRIVWHRKSTRNTPSGSIIESILLWDYQQLNNLYGYDVVRSVSDPQHFVSIATLRDPLADRFSDVDLALTPDVSYYYSVARLDTINLTTGAAGDPADPRVVIPLSPISAGSPASGVTVHGAPSFSWTSVNRAHLYQVVVYDRFPDYQSDTDPNGVRPIWPADQTHPGASLVQAPATSVVYQGPVLVSGHTYYWAVIAQDDVGSAFSITPIQSFIAQ